jgi:acetylornithine deacetylase/succinyl-diaminopimelate desuccinylase-like protein
MPRELKEIEKLKFNTNNYQEEIGVMPNGGEVGLDPMVRNGFRPTIEVNGIYGGYQGDGGKTIIPSRAGVKLSSRLVGGQDPENCMRLLKNYFTENAPEGLRLKFGHEEVGGPAVLLNPEANCVKLAEKVLADIFSNPADLIWEGASIPIVSSLAKYTNEQALLVGFGLEEDNIHAPNESFAIERMKKGFMYVSQILQQLSNL